MLVFRRIAVLILFTILLNPLILTPMTIDTYNVTKKYMDSYPSRVSTDNVLETTLVSMVFDYLRQNFIELYDIVENVTPKLYIVDRYTYIISNYREYAIEWKKNDNFTVHIRVLSNGSTSFITAIRVSITNYNKNPLVKRIFNKLIMRGKILVNKTLDLLTKQGLKYGETYESELYNPDYAMHYVLFFDNKLIKMFMVTKYKIYSYLMVRYWLHDVEIELSYVRGLICEFFFKDEAQILLTFTRNSFIGKPSINVDKVANTVYDVLRSKYHVPKEKISVQQIVNSMKWYLVLVNSSVKPIYYVKVSIEHPTYYDIYNIYVDGVSGSVIGINKDFYPRDDEEDQNTRL